MRRAIESLWTRLGGGGGWGRCSTSQSDGARSSSSNSGGGDGGVITHPHNPSLAWPPSAKHSIAYIEEITAVSPTVKQVQLRLLCGKSNPPQPPFTFRAGQWVDFYIQGLQRCGGYSMVSGPETLPQLTLAVKESALSEPAQWVHREARPMDHVAMRVGGSFFFEMTPEHWRRGTRLVLVGGGVGINPLVSILRHVTAWLDANGGGGDGPGGGFRVSLVHSAATAEELLFRHDIEALAQQHPGVITAPQFICTRDPAWKGRTARIDAPLLSSLVPSDAAAAARTLVYVCGPASMIDDSERVYTTQDGPGGRAPLRKDQVLFERWW